MYFEVEINENFVIPYTSYLSDYSFNFIVNRLHFTVLAICI